MHEGVRIFVAGLRAAPVGDSVSDEDEEDMPFLTLINPEITLISEPVSDGWEGCLSIPDIRGLVPRATEIRVKAYDRTGARVVVRREGTAGARDPARDRSPEWRAVPRSHEVLRVAGVHGRIPALLDCRGRRMSLTETEATQISAYFTNTDRPVFALTNLPETVKGALFARYSRSPKSLRRLFLDEFYDAVGAADDAAAAGGSGAVKSERADKLYQRVFNDYGDDSVAQLGGVHLAVEDASNILTKVLERGRLMAYLEQSTRYIPYTERRGDRMAVPGARRARRPSASESNTCRR